MSKGFRFWSRCTLVATLAVLTTFHPAWAGKGLRGWLKKRHAAQCCSVEPSCESACEPEPGCCEPEPVCCEPEPVCCDSAPVVSCEPAPAPICCDSVTTMEVPMMDIMPMDSVTESPTQIVPDATPAFPADPAPEAPEVAEDKPEVAPQSPEVTEEPAAPSSSDLFGAEEPAVESNPSDDLFTEPATAPETTEPSIVEPAAPADDLFAEPTPEPAAPAGDDLFGEPAPATGDDLFGEPAPATGDDLFNEPAPATENADDLFGDPAPAAADDLFGDPAPAAGDDLFGDPAPASPEPATGTSTDIFEEPPADATGNEPLFGAPEDSVDDLFSQPTSMETETSETPNFDDLFGAPRVEEVTEPATNDAQPSSEQEEDPFADLFKSTDLRQWNDNTGLFSVTAKLTEIRADSVRLLKDNGAYCTVPMRRLSDLDRQFVERVASTLPAGEVKFVSLTK